MMLILIGVKDKRTRNNYNVRSKEVKTLEDGARWVLSLKNRCYNYFIIATIVYI